jgi:hypothetical protein
MAYKRKTWQEKLDGPKGLPKVVKIRGRMSRRWGTGTVVIPEPREVDELMKSVPKGRVTTINEIRTKLAKRHKATIGCPITCGIFANISAHAADEEEAAGRSFKFTMMRYNRLKKLKSSPINTISSFGGQKEDLCLLVMR